MRAPKNGDQDQRRDDDDNDRRDNLEAPGYLLSHRLLAIAEGGREAPGIGQTGEILGARHAARERDRKYQR